MALPTRLKNLEFAQGDYQRMLVSCKDENGAALDLTGMTLTYALSRTAEDASPLITKTIGSGITVISAAGGQIQIDLLSADTASLLGEYYHELEVVSGPNHNTLFRGKVNFVQDLIA
jgi:hypothetical protein